MFTWNRKASSVLEYAIALGIVSMTLTAMSTYLKRGIQARVKDMTTGLIVEDLYDRHQDALACDPNDPDYLDCIELQGVHQYVANTAQSESAVTMTNTRNETTVGKARTNTFTEQTTRIADDDSVMQGWEDCLDGSC